MRREIIRRRLFCTNHIESKIYSRQKLYFWYFSAFFLLFFSFFFFLRTTPLRTPGKRDPRLMSRLVSWILARNWGNARIRMELTFQLLAGHATVVWLGSRGRVVTRTSTSVIQAPARTRFHALTRVRLCLWLLKPGSVYPFSPKTVFFHDKKPPVHDKNPQITENAEIW